MKLYYFDYAASTPVDPEVVKAMEPYWSEKFGNPGALHWFGQEASAAVFKARDTIAKSLGCDYREIIFTGSATESNNLALRGITQTVRRITQKNFSESPRLVRDSLRPKLIVSAIEHDSVLETARDLERDGIEVVYLPVDKNGIVDLEKLKKELDERTVLVSVMYTNNEIGTIQPITKISEIIRNFREVKCQMSNVKCPVAYPLFHCDAVQAFNYLPCNVNDLGIDLLTLSAQKIYGPKGVGALYARTIDSKQLTFDQKNTGHQSMVNGQWLSPLVTGGSQQESGFRAGTENVPGIVGFGKAVEIVERLRDLEIKRLSKLQDYFWKQLKKNFPKVQLNGSPLGENRICNNLNFYFGVGRRSVGESQRQKLSVSAQDLIIKLDLAGFAVSPGSACSARVCSPSHVLKALGYSDERATNSIRITFGRQTNKEAIDKLLKIMYTLIRVKVEK